MTTHLSLNLLSIRTRVKNVKRFRWKEARLASHVSGGSISCMLFNNVILDGAFHLINGVVFSFFV